MVQRVDLVVAIACVPCGPRRSLIYACEWGFWVCWKLSAAVAIKSDCCRPPAVVSIFTDSAACVLSFYHSTPLQIDWGSPKGCSYLRNASYVIFLLFYTHFYILCLFLYKTCYSTVNSSWLFFSSKDNHNIWVNCDSHYIWVNCLNLYLTLWPLLCEQD